LQDFSKFLFRPQEAARAKVGQQATETAPRPPEAATEPYEAGLGQGEPNWPLAKNEGTRLAAGQQ